MPTVLKKCGWRFLIYPNEGNEPIHIHARKAGMDAKFWLHPADRTATIAFTYHLAPKDLREVRGIIRQHFNELITAWHELQQRQKP
jgi:hypothetical protein